jgi:Protein of Unknown function (DUF2784)
MVYHLLVDATVVLHFAFLAYVVAGGFLAWRWPRAIWPHLLAAGWALATLVFSLHCPLTWLEDWGRRKAGGSGLSRGFIDTYLTGIVYPERYTGLLQVLAAAVVAVSWLGHVRRLGRNGGRAAAQHRQARVARAAGR